MKYSVKILVVVFLIVTKHITGVQYPVQIVQCLSDVLLKNLESSGNFKIKTLVQVQSQMCVANVVMYRLSGVISRWLYPWFKSIFENTVEPVKIVISSCNVGDAWWSRLIAVFGAHMSTHMSTHIRTFPDVFWAPIQVAKPKGLVLLLIQSLLTSYLVGSVSRCVF